MYKTKDLCLAATLESIEIPIVKITTTPKGKHKEATMWFDDSPEIDIVISKFWKRELKIEPRTYFSNLKGIKGRIYEND